MLVLVGTGDPELAEVLGQRVTAMELPTVMKCAGEIDALVLDARTPIDRFGAEEILRALYDDPRRPRWRLRPERVLAWIGPHDVEGAFALGRFGIAAAVTDLATMRVHLARMQRVPLQTTPRVPVQAPTRSTRLGPRRGAEQPTVAVGYQHAPETLHALAHYQRVLLEHAHESSVFADVATLLEVMVREGLTCQTNLAAKAGVSHSGQFIGSFSFYRSLRHTRYAHIPDHPSQQIAMDVFIAVDEVLHEVLHLLFLANELRSGAAAQHTAIAEELSLTWWQGVIHQKVFPEWLQDGRILAINDDFLVSETNAKRRGFFEVGTVFSRYETYPWVPYVIEHLPQREHYIGERPDLDAVLQAWAPDPQAAFLCADPAQLRVPLPFAAFPPLSPAFRYHPSTSPT